MNAGGHGFRTRESSAIFTYIFLLFFYLVSSYRINFSSDQD